MEESIRTYKWFSDVVATEVTWLWYPYIPFGKISVLQGDPGCGKSMLMIDVIAKLTGHGVLPDGRSHTPVNVIYQCSEDGINDTIRPRLERAGADCSKVAYINEDLITLSLNDEKLKQTIQDVGAKLLVIDPFQAYIGDSDLSSVTGMRRVMSKLGQWAAAYNCAVVLVGHLNKKSGQKELYRGLGSVDIMAAARSVMQIEKIEDGSSVRLLRHVKSSLSGTGATLVFDIGQDGRFRWLSDETAETARQHLFQDTYAMEANANNKLQTAANVMVKMLTDGPQSAKAISDEIMKKGIGERTIKSAKKRLGIISFRKAGQWYWNLPGNELSPSILDTVGSEETVD